MNDKIKKHESVCIDANTAVSYISYAVSDIAWIYPITPSSPMAEYADLLSSSGIKNIFGNDVKVIEMQSESACLRRVGFSLLLWACLCFFQLRFVFMLLFLPF